MQDPVHGPALFFANWPGAVRALALIQGLGRGRVRDAASLIDRAEDKGRVTVRVIVRRVTVHIIVSEALGLVDPRLGAVVRARGQGVRLGEVGVVRAAGTVL